MGVAGSLSALGKQVEGLSHFFVKICPVGHRHKLCLGGKTKKNVTLFYFFAELLILIGFNSDPDPDPAFYLNADPDPDLKSDFAITKSWVLT
jgi:hypothetical protein